MLFDEQSLERETTKIMKNCEGLINDAFKASGKSFMDVLLDMDAKTGAMIGGYVSLYKDAKDLVIMQAKAMDQMLKDFDELREMNNNLCIQNEKLQSILQDLNREVQKIGK